MPNQESEAIESIVESGEKNGLEQAEQDLTDIYCSQHPIQKLHELADVRRGPQLESEEAGRLKRALSSSDVREADSARALLAWHCIPTLSTVLKKFDVFIVDEYSEQEFFEAGMEFIQKAVNSWEANTEKSVHLTQHVNNIVTSKFEGMVTASFNCAVVDLPTIEAYYKASQQYEHLYGRKPIPDDHLEVMEIIKEEGYLSTIDVPLDRQEKIIRRIQTQLANNYFDNPDIETSNVPAPGTEYRSDKYSRSGAVEYAITGLNTRYAQALQWRAEGDTYETIGRRLGVTQKRAAQIISQATRVVRNTARNEERREIR